MAITYLYWRNITTHAKDIMMWVNITHRHTDKVIRAQKKKNIRWHWHRVLSATEHTVTPKIWLDRNITHYDILLEIHFQISPHPHNLFRLRSILMLSFHLQIDFPSSLFLSGYTTSNLYAFLLHPTPATRCALIAPPPRPLIWLSQ